VVDAFDCRATVDQNKDRTKRQARDPDPHSSKKGNPLAFRHEAHIGAVRLKPSAYRRCTSGHVSDITRRQNTTHCTVRKLWRSVMQVIDVQGAPMTERVMACGPCMNGLKALDKEQ
jgi:hypothetical protein